MEKSEDKTEKLLSLAEQIGRMLQDTSEYRDFQKASVEYNSSSRSVSLLERYAAIEEENAARISAGDSIEPFILEEAEIMRESIESDDIIMNFLQARKRYLNLLEQVQKELENTVSGREE